MLYQLPNGRVINISVEDYLELSDTDLQRLSGDGIGDFVNSPWYKSMISKKRSALDLLSMHDDGIDFEQDDDKPPVRRISEITEEPFQENLPDLPESQEDVE